MQLGQVLYRLTPTDALMDTMIHRHRYLVGGLKLPTMAAGGKVSARHPAPLATYTTGVHGGTYMPLILLQDTHPWNGVLRAFLRATTRRLVCTFTRP